MGGPRVAPGRAARSRTSELWRDAARVRPMARGIVDLGPGTQGPSQERVRRRPRGAGGAGAAHFGGNGRVGVRGWLVAKREAGLFGRVRPGRRFHRAGDAAPGRHAVRAGGRAGSLTAPPTAA